jgi:hypothetical protein
MDNWYPHEGGVESYTTNDLDMKNVMQDMDKTLTTASGLTPVEFPKFEAFRKIPRLFRDVTITEKLDGSNGSITITEDGQIRAGCRTRYIYPNKPKEEGKKAEVTDNFGFAAWVEEHKVELLKLGKGRHFGEWYGKGINRGYGLQDKRFALFNVSIDRNTAPNCVEFVPVLFSGTFDTGVVKDCLRRLAESGSAAVPGWMKPEGVVIFHCPSRQLFKTTIENDAKPKGVTE